MRSIAFFFIAILSSSVVVTAPLRAQDAAHALAQKFAGEDKPVTGPKAPSSPAPVRTPPPPEYEREMLDRARAEAEQRKTAAQPQSARPEPATKATEPTRPATTAAVPAAAPAPAEAAPATTSRRNVATILVVLSHLDDGTAQQSFDPIVCAGERCYVSAGSADPARAIARKDVLSTKHAISGGAGACAGKGACAFRAVPIENEPDLQIVDLGIVRHDLRDPVRVEIDTTCNTQSGALMCDSPFVAPDYRIWVVPEAIAAEATAAALDAALESELPQLDITLETDK